MAGFTVICLILFSSTFTFLTAAHGLHDRAVDLIIFSYDRPLQLYALLESAAMHMHGLDTIHVVCRCSNQSYENAYAEVWQEFPNVTVYQQSSVPEQDFKKLTMQAIAACPHDYILFAVDDIVVSEDIDCEQCTELLEQYAAYAFYLRLGKNLNYCYSERRAQPLPQFILDDGTICLWQFSSGVFDWNYPHTVDMTIYRKNHLLHDLNSFSYDFAHPTQLESFWAQQGGRVALQRGICFAHSKIVNIPMNLVQQVVANNNMNYMSCAELLEVFNQHKKIDVSLLQGVENKSAHMAFIPTFIER
jgi:hypothetical protein